ncbi:hypothetical protein EBV26_05155 [bacterium]|nr:hypothetical protein [bacterium]
MAIIDNNNSNFRPLDWDSLRIPYDPSNTITGINTAGTISYNLPGELLQYSMDYDIDAMNGSGLPQDEMETMFKKQLSEELAKKMVADGHIVFTKQYHEETRKMRYRSYAWVGNKDFIEQQRKNKR